MTFLSVRKTQGRPAQTDRQTDGQTDRRTDGPTEKQTDRHTLTHTRTDRMGHILDTHTHRPNGGQLTDRQTYTQPRSHAATQPADAQTEWGTIQWQTDRSETDRQTDRQTNKHENNQWFHHANNYGSISRWMTME